jgi:CO/xanthine dehydrogenase FAD-binding subunit
MGQEYRVARTVDEALSLLAARAGAARLIAGGTDLVSQLRRGERQAACLVDVSRIDALRAISEAGGFLTVGAAVTHSELATSPLIRERAPLLGLAASEVGSPEIRNAGTVGGNVVNAQPAADAALALLALDAEAEIVSASASRWVPLVKLYREAGVSAVDSSAELVRAFRFRVPAGPCGSAYRRLGKCKSIALPVLCAATVVRLEGDQIAAASIALGPVAPHPFRAGKAEAWLVGQPVAAATFARAGALARDEAHPRDSLLRCSKEYREAMVSVLVRSTLEEAVSVARKAAEGGR